MPRRRQSRIYWRNGRAWGDFRDFSDVGGAQVPLKVRGERYATTDPDIAGDLATDLVKDFEEKRRNRGLGNEPPPEEEPARLGPSQYHLEEKARSGKFATTWLVSAEMHMRRAVRFFGSSASWRASLRRWPGSEDARAATNSDRGEGAGRRDHAYVRAR